MVWKEKPASCSVLRSVRRKKASASCVIELHNFATVATNKHKSSQKFFVNCVPFRGYCPPIIPLFVAVQERGWFSVFRLSPRPAQSSAERSDSFPQIITPNGTANTRSIAAITAILGLRRTHFLPRVTSPARRARIGSCFSQRPRSSASARANSIEAGRNDCRVWYDLLASRRYRWVPHTLLNGYRFL